MWTATTLLKIQGVVLGEAIKRLWGDKKEICRYGSFILPMDDVLVLVAMDLSGRPWFGYDVALSAERVGDFDTEMVRGVFLCHILQCRNESAHQITFRRE